MPASWLHSNQGKQCLDLYSGPSQSIALNTNILQPNAPVLGKSANSTKKNPGSSDTKRSNIRQKVSSDQKSEDSKNASIELKSTNFDKSKSFNTHSSDETNIQEHFIFRSDSTNLTMNATENTDLIEQKEEILPFTGENSKTLSNLQSQVNRLKLKLPKKKDSFRSLLNDVKSSKYLSIQNKKTASNSDNDHANDNSDTDSECLKGSNDTRVTVTVHEMSNDGLEKDSRKDESLFEKGDKFRKSIQKRTQQYVNSKKDELRSSKMSTLGLQHQEANLQNTLNEEAKNSINKGNRNNGRYA